MLLTVRVFVVIFGIAILLSANGLPGMTCALVLFGLWLLYKILIGFRLLVRGITKLRFTLQSMMIVTVAVAACGAMLTDIANRIVFSLGLASTMVTAGFVVSYLIILGACEE